MKLLRVQQGDYGGQYVKPTGLGTDLNVKKGTVRNGAVGRSAGLCQDTKKLARWTPGLYREIARALMEAFGKEVKLRKMSWQEHIALGHTPFRRDCRICQEAAAKDRPHRRVAHPLSGCLSIDITGPLICSQDQQGEKRYMLIGAFTWVKQKKVAHEDASDEALGEGLPDVEGGDEMCFEDEQEDHEMMIEDEDARSPDVGPHRGEHEEKEEESPELAVDPSEEGRKELSDEEKKALEDFDVETFRLAVALPSRAAQVVLEAIIQMYLQLRMDGYYVKQLHSDRAREFTTRTLQRWCLNRGIYKTTTAGDSPQQNGRAEKAVQTIKAKMRVALLGCGWEAEKWALACQHVHNAERSRMKPMKKVPALGTSVLVRKRFWKSRELEPTHTKVVYVSPMPEVH